MALTPGARVGSFEIAALIGAGGMGEVYRATDTNLKRPVAIKVLPSSVAGDADRLARFQREAELLGALNHPNIAQIYGVEKSDGAISLVMELVEGPTLADRLTQGALPLEEALCVATQVAAALAAAHDSGIVHRDLKPANIKLRPDGTAKLLDFGLAKQQFAPAIGADAPGSPTEAITLPASLTAPGMMLGTVPYMSPEQLEGGPTDARTDVFAFGLVLFEMITGRKAFDMDSRRSLIVAILDRTPPRLATLQPSVPRWLDDLVSRCLAKNRDERWTSMRQVLSELQAPRQPTGRPAPSADAVPTRPAGLRTGIMVASAGALAAAALIALAIFGSLSPQDAGAPGAGTSEDVQSPSLAVLPIGWLDPPDADAAARLGVGIADAIVTKLANVRAIRVRPTSAIVSLDWRTMDAALVARRLQVDHVLSGTVRRDGEAYRFNLQLVRVGDNSLVWGRQIDVSERRLFTIEDQVSAEVVAALRLQISSTEQARLTQPPTEMPDAYGEYLQGRALLANYSDSNLRQAMTHFERALQIDPSYALANAALATAAGTFSVRFAYEQQAIEWGRRAEEYASRALMQNPSLAEAHLALANAAGTLYRNFDWPTVVREAQVALTLNPNLDLAHAALARAFYHLGLLDWSESESTLAIETSGGTNVEVSRVHLSSELLSGRFAEARQLAERLAEQTNAPVIQQYLGLASFYLGDRERARERLDNVRRPDGRPDTRSQASLAGILAASGRRDEAERTVRAVVESGYMDHHVAYALGAAQAQLGRPAEAVKWLREAARTGFPCYPWLERDSLLDPIRSDPAFKTLLTGLRADYDNARTRYQAVLRQP